MKATALFVSILALCMLIIPMIAVNYKTGAVNAQTHSPGVSMVAAENLDIYPPYANSAGDDEQFENEMAAIALEEENTFDEYAEELDEEPGDIDEYDGSYYGEAESVSSFLILDESTGEVNEVSIKDFVRGAVAAEMPASFHSEALKAQAVAAHTFALHSHLAQQESPDPNLRGADFKADPSNMKVYVTEETAKKFYGENAEIYWDKICDAADSVMDYVLAYDGEPIVAAYHAISAGNTEDASNIWTGSAPYLVSVPSKGDLLAPGYESSVTLTSVEVREKLAAARPDITLGDSPEGWFGQPLRSDSGYVSEIGVGDDMISGKDIRQIFGLRSHDFTVEYTDNDEFVFTVTGYGHGVGLSQYGADFLARQGDSYDNILNTYYPGAKLMVAK